MDEPIILTAINSHASKEIIELLIEHGDTIAVEDGFNAVCQLLPEESASVEELKHFQWFVGRFVPPEVLNMHDRTAHTPLSYAVARHPREVHNGTTLTCNQRVINILMHYGADILAPGPLGATNLNLLLVNYRDGTERFQRVLHCIDQTKIDLYATLRGLIPDTSRRVAFLSLILPAEEHLKRFLQAIVHRMLLIGVAFAQQDVLHFIKMFHLLTSVRDMTQDRCLFDLY